MSGDEKRRSEAAATSAAVALELVRKMVAYEVAIDAKEEQTPAEQRHVAFLRALRTSSLFGEEVV
jgi:hypothetical protein